MFPFATFGRIFGFKKFRNYFWTDDNYRFRVENALFPLIGIADDQVALVSSMTSAIKESLAPRGYIYTRSFVDDLEFDEDF